MPHERTPQDEVPGADLSRASRVLVVDEEIMIALDVADALQAAGFSIVGPAYAIEDALRLLDGLDAALIEARVAGTSAEPLAEALRARTIPFIVLTGYPRDALGAVLARARYVAKPTPPRLVVSALTALLGGCAQKR
jgi:DNA-binding response OmpR family regulator